MRDEGRSAGPVVGVEICLDHSDHRMRKAVARSPWPQRHDGLDLHLVPSCGMQLHPQSVAARRRLGVQLRQSVRAGVG